MHSKSMRRDSSSAASKPQPEATEPRPITEYTDHELRAELSRRADEQDRKAVAARRAENEQVVANIDLLLKLIAEHSQHHCNDREISDSEDCSRCILLEAKKRGSWLDQDLCVRAIVERDPLHDPDQLDRDH